MRTERARAIRLGILYARDYRKYAVAYLTQFMTISSVRYSDRRASEKARQRTEARGDV